MVRPKKLKQHTGKNKYCNTVKRSLRKSMQFPSSENIVNSKYNV